MQLPRPETKSYYDGKYFSLIFQIIIYSIFILFDLFLIFGIWKNLYVFVVFNDEDYKIYKEKLKIKKQEKRREKLEKEKQNISKKLSKI